MFLPSPSGRSQQFSLAPLGRLNVSGTYLHPGRRGPAYWHGACPGLGLVSFQGKSIYTSFSGQKCFGKRVQFFSNCVGIVNMRSLEKNLIQAFCFFLISLFCAFYFSFAFVVRGGNFVDRASRKNKRFCLPILFNCLILPKSPAFFPLCTSFFIASASVCRMFL